MTEVLLIHPPYEWQEKSPPLGLAYIAAVLEDAGFNVIILDMDVMGLKLDEIEQQIKIHNPGIIGISCMTLQAKRTIEIAKIAKKVDASVPIVVGGAHASALPEEMLNPGFVDYVVIGEGELTMKELVQKIFGGNIKPDEIQGLAFRKSGKIVKTKPRPLIPNLDDLPFPAWHLLPIEKYNESEYGFDVNKSIFNVLSSRGCPYHCIFCASHILFGRKFRARSAENMFAELKMLNQKYGCTQIDFVDDTITVDRDRMMALCDLIINSNLQISWACNARVNTVTKQLLRKMKKAGCIRIDFGVESGDPVILKRIKKGITIEQVVKAHKDAKDVGLPINSFFMIGNLGEDIKSIKKTLALIDELTSNVCFSISTPFPGTELYQIAKESGLLKVYDWDKYATGPSVVDYKPVMETDKMNQEQILQAFRYVLDYCLRLNIMRKYGTKYFLNPQFYWDNREKFKDLHAATRSIKTLMRLVTAKAASYKHKKIF